MVSGLTPQEETATSMVRKVITENASAAVSKDMSKTHAEQNTRIYSAENADERVISPGIVMTDQEGTGLETEVLVTEGLEEETICMVKVSSINCAEERYDEEA